jgi:hypothetical protein
LESSEEFFLRARSLELSLRGLGSTHEPNLDVKEYFERQAAADVLIADTKAFFDDLRRSDFKCLLQTGGLPVSGHLLRRLGQERALFETGLIEPESWLELDYAEFHNVPQDCPHDMPHGHASQSQLYVGSTKSGLAISIHQLSQSFLNGASWDLSYRPLL